jgi:hypothetical protein
VFSKSNQNSFTVEFAEKRAHQTLVKQSADFSRQVVLAHRFRLGSQSDSSYLILREIHRTVNHLYDSGFKPNEWKTKRIG